MKHACLSHSRTLQSGRAATIRSNAASPLIAGNLQGCTLFQDCPKEKTPKKHKKDKNKKKQHKDPPPPQPPLVKNRAITWSHVETHADADLRSRSAEQLRRLLPVCRGFVGLCGVMSHEPVGGTRLFLWHTSEFVSLFVLCHLQRPAPLPHPSPIPLAHFAFSSHILTGFDISSCACTSFFF